MRIELEEGKYTYVFTESGEQFALRHGEPWRDLTGDKFVYCMAAEITRLQPLNRIIGEQRAEIEKRKEYLKAYKEVVKEQDVIFRERLNEQSALIEVLAEALEESDANHAGDNTDDIVSEALAKYAEYKVGGE